MLVQALNALDRAGFVAVCGSLYEHSPWVAEAAHAAAPFTDMEDLHASMCVAVDGASKPWQRELIMAHPDLAGKLARAGTLTDHSAGEQGGLGLDRLSDEEFERFDRLNRAYRTSFGFPFIIAVKDNTRETILAAFERRLLNTPDQEFEEALTQIKRIGWHRLKALVG